MRSNASSERGAILIQVALALVMLIGFSMFAFDYGVMWTGRGEAQNAADAGALAGATALAFDSSTDRTDTGPAKVAAHEFAVDNLVWGQAPANDVSTDVTFPTTPAAFCADNSCIRVDVYRDSTRGNPLPAIFGTIVGLPSQGVKAMAIARAATGNATNCLKPWAVVDRWVEHWCWSGPSNKPVGATCNPNPGTFDPNTSTFDKYDMSGNTQGQVDASITTPDEYIPPSDGDFGSGYHPYDADGTTYSSDFGTELVLKTDSPSQSSPGQDWGAGWFMSLALGGNGGKTYKQNIESCAGVTYKIGDDLELDTETGDMVGPTNQGVETDTESLCNQDPGAHWDTTLNDGKGGVAGSAFAVSPRIVAIPLVNPDLLAEAVANNTANGKSTIPISNIMGFFVECKNDPNYPSSSMKGNNASVVGRLMNMPGLISTGTGSTNNSFLKVIELVR